jgi:cell division protein FtsI/penicillin-binding protein 2
MPRFPGVLGVASAALLVLASSAVSVQAARSPSRSKATARSRKKPTPPPPPPVVLPAEASSHDKIVGEACRRGLGGTSGGVLAMDPRTGRVIAVINPRQALFNAYQPCSVFKIVVAIAGLSENVITPESTYNCSRGCWMWPGHGPINLRRALAVSCNPYFEWIGEQLGYERIQRYSHLLGLGTPSGINLTGETAGRLPLSVSAAAVGHLSSHAKGIATTAVQLGVLLSATINGGIVYQPQIRGPVDFEPRERWRLPPGTVLGGLAEGFLGAVNEGSASSAFDPEVIVAGKTGSCASVGWFASYAPADRPEIVIVVFLRPGNGHAASGVAGRIYQELYKAPPMLTTAGAQ